MPRGCCGTCGCLAAVARSVVDSPLNCCSLCCTKRRHQRRFLEHFSRFHQVNDLESTPEGGQPQQQSRQDPQQQRQQQDTTKNSTTATAATRTNKQNDDNNNMTNGRSSTASRVPVKARTNIRVLVCTANLGNEQPNAESMAQWIPPDGFFIEDTASTEMDESNHSVLHELTSAGGGGDGSESQADSGEDIAEVSGATPYQTKYPLRYQKEGTLRQPSFDDSMFQQGDDDDDAIKMDALSKQLDLIVVGLQEATFDPPKNESMSESSSTNGRDAGAVRIRVPMVKPLRKLQTLRAAKDFSESALQQPKPSIVTKASSLSTSNPLSSIRTKLCTVLREEWEDGTHALHSLFEGRLPSYTRLVSYQRGQMRLLVFGRTQSFDPVEDPPLPLQVLHTAAQNTGRAGLANKGGIVTEILVNGSTRLSFVSCHLEAHEGQSKYAIRCQTLADILRGTAHRKKVVAMLPANDKTSHSAHHVIPSPQSASHSYESAIDVSLTAHYSFVLGDLNFRTDLSFVDPALAEDEEGHKQSVRNMVAAQDWKGLNAADELHRALLNKHCLVGFRTLFCNFPPTFKVERKAGYEYIDKRRPSYTDRVLFKTGHELEKGLKPILYEPIDNFTTSDHKPVRAAFAVDLNPHFRVRPRAVRHESVRWSTSQAAAVRKSRRLQLSRIFRGRSTADDDDVSLSSNASVVDLGHGQGLGRSANQLQLFVSNISINLNKIDGSSHGAPSPYVMLMSQPEQAIRGAWKERSPWKRVLNRLMLKAPSLSERTKVGWPCSSKKPNTYAAHWGEEEIDCQILTHTPEGGSIDLSGAILFLTAMDGNVEDTLLGTVCFNLTNLIRNATENKRTQSAVRSSIRQSAISTSSQPQTHHRRVRRQTLLGSIFRGRQGSERGSGRFFGFARNESEDELNEDEDPVVAVEIEEHLLKDGVEVGTLRCTIEAWWMDDSTARIIRVQDSDHPAPTESNRSLFKLRKGNSGPHKAERRAAFREEVDQ